MCGGSGLRAGVTLLTPKPDQDERKARQNEDIRQVENTGLEAADFEHDEIDHPAVVAESVDEISARTRKKQGVPNTPDAVKLVRIGKEEDESDDDDCGGNKVDRAPKILGQSRTNTQERTGVLSILESHHTEEVNGSGSTEEFPLRKFFRQLVASDKEKDCEDEDPIFENFGFWE
jgi:hypothetical protein